MITTFPHDDYYQPMNATWVHDLRTFSGCLMGKTQQNEASVAPPMEMSRDFISTITSFRRIERRHEDARKH